MRIFLVRFKPLILSIGLFASIPSFNSFAENHALIIGIGNYPYQPLEGPLNDARAIKNVLETRWQFKSKNIHSLINQEATRDNILKAIDKLYARTKPEDNIFFYYSGHGTSIYDNTIQAPLPNTSGALIPYDVRGLKTKAELMNKLIKGRDDLRPRFSKLDKGRRHLFIAIDACYSGNTIRNLKDPLDLPTRFINLSALFSDKESAKNVVPEANTPEADEIQGEYPYENIFYLSAASEHEKAQDIPARMLHKLPTIDNKPHGAFTNSLLEFLHQPEKADLNKDKSISYREITQALSTRMEERGFSHSPSALPIQQNDDRKLGDQALFFIDSVSLNTNDDDKPKGKNNTLKELGFK
jgi:hypothetical protein